MKRGESCMTDLEGFDGKIKEHFKDKILKEIIDEAKDYMTYTLVKEVNKELYDYGTHYKVGGGLGFDFSMTQAPTVTDDKLLTIFMNGTFYGEKPHVNSEGEPYAPYETYHDIFEIGAHGH